MYIISQTRQPKRQNNYDYIVERHCVDTLLDKCLCSCRTRHRTSICTQSSYKQRTHTSRALRPSIKSHILSSTATPTGSATSIRAKIYHNAIGYVHLRFGHCIAFIDKITDQSENIGRLFCHPPTDLGIDLPPGWIYYTSIIMEY